MFSPERLLDALMQYEFNMSSTKKAGVCVDGDILALVAYADNRAMPVATAVAVQSRKGAICFAASISLLLTQQWMTGRMDL